MVAEAVGQSPGACSGGGEVFAPRSKVRARDTITPPAGNRSDASPPVILAALPIKPFGVAKARLAPVLGPAERSRLGRAIAARTAELTAAAGAEVCVVTADEGVAAWAKERELGVLREAPELGIGLNAAAAVAARHADRLGMRWAIVHADLPVATAADLDLVFGRAATDPVIVPSHDGGTNLIGGAGSRFPFSYGKGSFHRHLAHLPGATIITNPRLALDLDTPADLARARASPSGRWLEAVIAGE